MKGIYLPSKTNANKIFEARFCRRKAAEDNNTKYNVSPNIPCTFLLFKGSAFLQNLFLRKSKFCERQFFSIVND